MSNKDKPTDSVQGPEQAPSLLESICGKNGYGKTLGEAEDESVDVTAKCMEFVNRAAETKRQRDMLLDTCKDAEKSHQGQKSPTGISLRAAIKDCEGK